MQTSPEATGHIICYGGRVGRAGEAQARCARARNYLFTRRGIEASRIVAEDGGFRENLTVEFWAVPLNARPPIASPTIDPSEVKIIRNQPKARSRRR